MSAQDASVIPRFESHIDLLELADSVEVLNEDDIGLNAIVVPSARCASDYLSAAVELARELGCWILVLCSRDARPDEVVKVFEACHMPRAVAIDIQGDYCHQMFDFATSSPQITDQAVHEKSDLSLKRNIGLVISRLLDWRRILFLDDDIRGLDAETVRRAIRLLAIFNRVGFRVTSHPDNSVICHANRDLNGMQDVFVGGSVLAVNCRSDLAFFPHIYNEDWLFLYDAVLKEDICVAGDVQQLWFDPYASPQRAASEEVGDVIAEGLLSRLHLAQSDGLPSKDYWEGFLDTRSRFLTDIMYRAKTANAAQIYLAVEAAREVLERLTSEQCLRFISLWQEDLGRWRRRLRKLKIHDSLESGFKELCLPVAFPCPPNSTLVLPLGGPNRQEVSVRLPDNPSALRDLRLQALMTSPDAFAADFQIEVERDREAEGYWQRMLKSATWFAAGIDGVDVGIAAVIQESDRPSWERHIQSMWVDPEYRQTGIGQQLVHAIARHAAEDGARLLSLWVFVPNTTARAFYIKLGFRSMEQVQALAGDPLERKEERFGARLM